MTFTAREKAEEASREIVQRLMKEIQADYGRLAEADAQEERLL